MFFLFYGVGLILLFGGLGLSAYFRGVRLIFFYLVLGCISEHFRVRAKFSYFRV